MDFSNESYVRLYVRDTTTWLRLGWDGQAVLTQVLRKMDMAGVMDIGDMKPWEAVVVHCRAPEGAAQAGMKACLDLGVFAHAGRQLVAPNFRAAQEAVKSDKTRQKESRERRRLGAMSQIVTEGHAESQDVTENHAESRRVTPSHAESPNAVQCGAVQDNPPTACARGDSSAWIDSFRRITGRDDFADGCGQLTGTEVEAVRLFRKHCRDDHGLFCARLTALMANDASGFLARQGLRHWMDTAIKTDHTKLQQKGFAPVNKPYENKGSFRD